MLSRIPVHRFAKPPHMPIIHRYFASRCSHRRLLSDSPVVTAAAEDRRRWVMLSTTSRCRCPDDSTFVAEANTVAESRTSKGGRVHVSFRCAAPPSSSYLYYDFPESARGEQGRNDRIRVVAAHGESILLEMHHFGSSSFVDHFVYRAAGAHWPASLSLLPVLDFLSEPDEVFPSNINPPPIRLTVEFCVLRSGMQKWELMEPVPVLGDEDEGGKGNRQKMLGSPGDVICVGDRFLCLVHYGYDFLLCDMADEASHDNPLRVGYDPPEVRWCGYGNDNPLRVGRMGAAGDNSVRFVSIHPYCCIRDHPDLDSGKDSDCWCWVSDRTSRRNLFVYTIKTWTMNLSMDESLEWVEDGEMDGKEILALPRYQGLPQAIPDWPIVCLDKSNVVCFLVSNYHFSRDDEKVWMVQLNINTKTLLSVAEFTYSDDCWYRKKYHHLQAEIQH